MFRDQTKFMQNLKTKTIFYLLFKLIGLKYPHAHVCMYVSLLRIKP